MNRDAALQVIKLRDGAAVEQPGGATSSLFSMTLAGNIEYFQADSCECASQWVRSLRTIVHPMSPPNTKLPLLDEAKHLSTAHSYQLTMSPLPPGTPEADFPQNLPIHSESDLQALGPVLSSLLTVADSTEPGTFRCQVYLFRTCIFYFLEEVPYPKFLSVLGADIRVDHSNLLFVLRNEVVGMEWSCSSSSEDSFLRWLAGLSFVRRPARLVSPSLREVQVNSNTILLVGLKHPARSGPLQMHSNTKEKLDDSLVHLQLQEWHAVLTEDSLHLFLSNEPTEHSRMDISLKQTSLVSLTEREWPEDVPPASNFFAIQAKGVTNECFLFYASHPDNCEMWEKAIESTYHLVSKNSIQVRCNAEKAPASTTDVIIPMGELEELGEHPFLDDLVEVSQEDISEPNQYHSFGIWDSAPSEDTMSEESDISSSWCTLRDRGETLRPKISVASFDLMNPDKVGFLRKKGNLVKRWSRRYFVLKGGNIYYFRGVTVSLDLLNHLCIHLT